MGWSHRNTALVEYLLMLLVGGTALWGIGLAAHAQANLLACWGAIFLGLASWVDRRWRQHQAVNKSVSEI